jgi:DnaJ-class molecular chaperone
MEYRDYYAALGVPRTASQADIKKAFRKLARQHHPDVNKSDSGAEKRFKEVNEAYAVLGDPEKRKAYDSLGADWEMYQRAGAGTGRAGDPFAGFRGFGGGGTGPAGVRFEYHGDPEDLAGFSDFFRTFFAGGAGGFTGGAGGGGRAATAGSPAGSRTRARAGSIEDLFSELGGADYPAGGARGARNRAPTAPTFEAEAEVTLDEVASGTKRHVELDGKRIEVTIPAGVADGQRIRFSGVGPNKSDVYLRVKVKRHPVFDRDGANLRRELPLTLAETLLGGEVPVETLNGRVLLRIPPETQNGRTFRLAGKGLPRFRGEGRGDLYAKATVVLPTGLDDRGRELAREFTDHVRQPDPRQHGR